MLILKASPDLEESFSQMLKQFKRDIGWRGIFLVNNDNVVLYGNSYSLCCSFDKRKIFMDMVKNPISESLALECRKNPHLINAINIIMYIFGKWGMLKGLNVKQKYTQLNKMFASIFDDFGVEVALDSKGVYFSENGAESTYEDILNKIIDVTMPEEARVERKPRPSKEEEKKAPKKKANKKREEPDDLPEEEPEEELPVVKERHEEAEERLAKAAMKEEDNLGLWYDMIWDMQNLSFDFTPLKAGEDKKDKIGKNFAKTGYMCPRCGNNLHMVVFPPKDEMIIKVDDDRVFMTRAFTCTNCKQFFTPKPEQLITEKDIYSLNFLNDDQAFNDYVELLGEKGYMGGNSNFNEYESVRLGLKKPEDKSSSREITDLEEALEDIDALSKEETSNIIDLMESGFYPKEEMEKFREFAEESLQKKYDESLKEAEKMGLTELNDLRFEAANDMLLPKKYKEVFLDLIDDVIDKKKSGKTSKEEDFTLSDDELGSVTKKDIGKDLAPDENNLEEISFNPDNADEDEEDIPKVKKTSKGFRFPKLKKAKKDNEDYLDLGLAGAVDPIPDDDDFVLGKEPSLKDSKSGKKEKPAPAEVFPIEDGPAKKKTVRKKPPKDKPLNDNLTKETSSDDGALREDRANGNPGEEKPVETNKLLEMASECNGKDYKNIDKTIKKIKAAKAKDENAKEKILTRLNQYKKSRGQKEAFHLLNKLPANFTKDDYKNLKNKFEKYNNEDVEDAIKALDKKLDEKETKEIKDIIKSENANSRLSLHKLFSKLLSKNFEERNVNPFLDRIKEKLKSADLSFLKKLFEKFGDLNFNELMALKEKLADSLVLPELKFEKLAEIEDRLYSLKAKETALLVEKTKKEMMELNYDLNPVSFNNITTPQAENSENPDNIILENAVNSYGAPENKYEMPIFCHDASRRPSGKRGFMITPEHVYSGTRTSRGAFKIKDIEGFEIVKKRFKPSLILKYPKEGDVSLPCSYKGEELNKFANSLNSLTKYLKERPESRSIEYMLKKEHESTICMRCGARYTTEEFCPECGMLNQK